MNYNSNTEYESWTQIQTVPRKIIICINNSKLINQFGNLFAHSPPQRLWKQADKLKWWIRKCDIFVFSILWCSASRHSLLLSVAKGTLDFAIRWTIVMSTKVCLCVNWMSIQGVCCLKNKILQAALMKSLAWALEIWDQLWQSHEDVQAWLIADQWAVSWFRVGPFLVEAIL